jgi:hypothetical protein
MATTITKRILAGSTDGFPINVSATAISATLVHTGPTSTNTIDEIWLYAANSTTNAVTCWLEWGNAASSSQRISFEVSALAGPELIIPGFPLQGRSATGASIYVGASTSNVLSLYGYVNRIVQT